MKQVLDAFASENVKPTRKCWVCRLPKEVRNQLIEGRSKGISQPTMVDWLVSEGHTGATRDKLDSCFRKRHYTGESWA